MQITTSDESRRFCDITIKHGDEELVWDTTTYAKATKLTVEEVFKEINGYWARLPLSRQDKIFSIYKTIHSILTDIFTTGTNVKELIELVYQLYEEMPFVELEAWVVNEDADIRFPTSLLTEYGIHPQARTYLKDDYKDLVVLGLALRVMVPIWGEYIKTHGNEVGSTYKEHAAMRLLLRSWVINSKPRHRLLEYMEHLIQKDKHSHSALVSGLGSTELPEWLLALACVRRIAVSPLSSLDEKSSLISSVHNFLTSSFGSMDRRFKSTVVEKHRNDSRSDNDNTSLVESYKVKQAISDGDLTALSIFTDMSFDENNNVIFEGNRPTAASIVDPSIDYRLVERCLAESHRVLNNPILPHHTAISQNVIHPAIPAAGVENLNPQAMVRVMAISQAILWHWGFYDLAVLVTAAPTSNNQDSVYATESRPRIPKELIERLLELYPHASFSGNKTDPQQLEKAKKLHNSGVKAIDIIAKEISNKEWNLYAPIELVRLSSAMKGTRRMYAPADIKTQLAKWVIRIATRNEWLNE